MAHEAYIIAEQALWWKQGLLAFLGFIIRLLFWYKPPIPWLRVTACLIFMLTALYFNRKWVPNVYSDETACLIGFYTNNLISALFRFWKVNEEGLMRKTRNWWNSDKK